jgi:hypothetical protein
MRDICQGVDDLNRGTTGDNHHAFADHDERRSPMTRGTHWG